jgi:glycosyltransferase involved in cell wall biosynthesis
MIKELGDTSNKEMIEIGSFIGESTVIFAQHFKHVIAIDPFLPGYDNEDPTSHLDFNSVFEDFQETVLEYKDKITVIKMKSDEAINLIEKKYDFIYIDGLHTYDGVISDIINYLPFVKPGGFIGGHDYTENVPRLVGVYDAVNEMFGKPDNVFRDNSWIKYIPAEGENKTKRQITWLAKFDDYSSMGILSQRILERLKSDFVCKSIIGETKTNNPIILNSFKHSKKEIGIMFSYPDIHSQLDEFETKVIYTGADTTGGIANFVENINNVDYILTPSTSSKNIMLNLGVKRPIHVLPHGVEIDTFKYTNRKLFDKFKFLYVGECSDRKGIFQLVEAFLFLFKDNQQVELHIKSNTGMLFYGSDKLLKLKENNQNIFLHFSDEGHNRVVELYNSCHAYVYPSRADTFGMTLLEAMSCGLPVISTELPGATELIDGRYFKVKHRMVPVDDHPWMLGEWGEADLFSLVSNMKSVYNDYHKIIESGDLKKNSDYVRDNFSWEKIVAKFENDILPKFIKKNKIITLITSFNRPEYLKRTLETLVDIREETISNDIYLVENSDQANKATALDIISAIENMDILLYDSETNLGQRGSLLQMLEDINLDDYEYIQFTDQDNIFHEKLSTYCEILGKHKGIWFVTGYMSKEHQELGWISTKWGNLCEKRSLRAGHMFMRIKDLKKLLPIRLDSQYGQPHNSSWHAGLDWELSYWNKNAPGRMTDKNFVLCLPGGVEHVGIESTMYQWDVLANEYDIDTLKSLRYKKSPE